jgi:hypothetical protein
MTYAITQLTGGNPTPFVRPAGVEVHTICTVSGAQPSTWCPSQREEYFAAGQPPLSPEFDVWRVVPLDTWSNLEASPECAEYNTNRMAINVMDGGARNWISQSEEGKQWARDMGFQNIYFPPDRKCNASDPHPQLQIGGVDEGQVITQNLVDISIIANATSGFHSWRLDWGAGYDPSGWTSLVPDTSVAMPALTKVATLDLTGLPYPQITLRLHVDADNGGYAEKKIHLTLNLPTPTPTLTETPSPVPSITPSPSITPIPSGTETPSFPPIPSETPSASDTP